MFIRIMHTNSNYLSNLQTIKYGCQSRSWVILETKCETESCYALHFSFSLILILRNLIDLWPFKCQSLLVTLWSCASDLWSWKVLFLEIFLLRNSKVHGANMGPIWGRQDPGGPHVGPMNFAIWVVFRTCSYNHPLLNMNILEGNIHICTVISLMMSLWSKWFHFIWFAVSSLFFNSNWSYHVQNIMKIIHNGFDLQPKFECAR